VKESKSLGVQDRAKRAAESRFMRACRLEAVDTTPVWLMRQAGRFMPEFREIRSRVSFLELCKNSELACEVTLMAVEQLKVDAAIIFADILLILDSYGVGLEYVKGEGPVIHNPVRTVEGVRGLKKLEMLEDLGYVYRAIELTRAALPDDIPLLGFAGAPFTIASYMIEGGASRNFENTKALMYGEQDLWHELMNRIAEDTAVYLNGQVAHGADALQIFDSWVGCLSPTDYERFVLPHMKTLASLLTKSVPIIQFGTGTTTLLPLMTQCGGSVIGVDWRINLSEAWRIIGYDKAIQGNLDPTVLLGSRAELKRQTLRVLNEAAGRQGHIFNLGHGVLPPTDPQAVRHLVELVHEYGGPARQ
jgi:uroporphyrinogen decarboxylase